MPAVEQVVAGIALQQVVARAAQERVVARAALEVIVAARPVEIVVAGAAHDMLVAVAADEDVVAVGEYDRAVAAVAAHVAPDRAQLLLARGIGRPGEREIRHGCHRCARGQKPGAGSRRGGPGTGHGGRQALGRHGDGGNLQAADAGEPGQRREIDGSAGRPRGSVRAARGTRQRRRQRACGGTVEIVRPRSVRGSAARITLVPACGVSRQEIVHQQQAQEGGGQRRRHLAADLGPTPAVAAGLSRSGNARARCYGRTRRGGADVVLHRFSSLVLDEPPIERALPGSILS